MGSTCSMWTREEEEEETLAVEEVPPTVECSRPAEDNETLTASLQAEALGDCDDVVPSLTQVAIQQQRSPPLVTRAKSAPPSELMYRSPSARARMTAVAEIVRGHALRSWKECTRRVMRKASPQLLKKPRSRRSTQPLPLQNEVSSAEARLNLALSDYGLRARSIVGDGACQFRAIADQLFQDQELHIKLRKSAVKQLRRHANKYAEFIEGESFDAYLNRMSKPHTWGDNLSLQALADRYLIQVCIFSNFLERCFLCVQPSGDRKPNHHVWLGFYAELHYTSLEPSS